MKCVQYTYICDKGDLLMSVVFKDITPVDLRIYLSVLSLHQPFTKNEFYATVLAVYPRLSRQALKYRCRKLLKNKMVLYRGHFRNKQYSCIFTKEELKDATYTYSADKKDYSNSFLVCGL